MAGIRRYQYVQSCIVARTLVRKRTAQTQEHRQGDRKRRMGRITHKDACRVQTTMARLSVHTLSSLMLHRLGTNSKIKIIQKKE